MISHPKIETLVRPGASSHLVIEAVGAVEIQAGGVVDGAPSLPKFDILAYTGSPMSLNGWKHPVVVEIAGVTTTGPEIPALRDHDHKRIVGQTGEGGIVIGPDAIRLSGAITGTNADASEITGHANNGFKWKSSIGARPDLATAEFVPKGKTGTANGRAYPGPVIIARNATLNEISFVAFGADPLATASIAAVGSLGSSHTGDHSMVDFSAWLQAKGFDDPDALSENQSTSLKAMFDAEPGRGNDDANDSPRDNVASESSRDMSAAVAEIRAEQKRNSAINSKVVQYGRERPKALDLIEAIGNEAIEKGWSIEQFDLKCLREIDSLGMLGVNGINTIVRAGRDKAINDRVIEAAVCQANGMDEAALLKEFKAPAVEAADSHFRGGMGLRDLLAMAARENGYTGPTNRDIQAIFESAFISSRGSGNPRIQASGFSTISLPTILSNVANKFVRVAFEEVEAGWRAIATVENVSDFKQRTTVSLTGDLEYEEVGPGGEIKHGTLGEEVYTNQARTFAKMIAITRRDIINDDLGALTRAPTRLGRGGALKINDEFWKAFLDNSAFFTTARGNYLAGATAGPTDSRLNIDGLTNAEVLFFNQTDPNGKPRGLIPSALLVPNALAARAAQLMNSTEIRDTTANSVYGVSNPHAGKYEVIRSSYLSNASYTGNSALAWYLIAKGAIEIVFLNGQQMPKVETAEADFNTLGIQMRAYHDFGASKQEYRDGVKMKGEA